MVKNLLYNIIFININIILINYTYKKGNYFLIVFMKEISLDCDVLIIGGGPIGSAVARDIAKKGYKVVVLEEDSEIGRPVRCSGIVSPKLIPLANVSGEIVLNELNCAYIHTISGKKVLIGNDKIRAVAIDREKLDKLLAEQAMSSGAKYIMRAKAIGINDQEKSASHVFKDNIVVNFLRNAKEEKIKTRLLIGADGVNSSVVKWVDLEEVKEIINALTFDIDSDICDGNFVNLMVSRSYVPGFFAWIIPINNKMVRFGMGISSSYNGSINQYFNRLKQLNLKPFSHIFKNFNSNKISVGKIPLGLIKKTYGDRVMIVGDAACQVKPITGGGLYYGLISAKRCAQVAVEALKRQDFSEGFLSKYQRLWMKDIGTEIEQGLRLRNIFLSLNDDDIDELLDTFGQEEFIKIINRYGDIDFPWRLVLKIIAKKPYILKYLKKYVLEYKLNLPNQLS